MAKFPFKVKHNGILYAAGKEVPIGKEAKKEDEIADKTATEIRNELKQKYGVTKFKGNSKKDLMEQLIEVEKESKEIAPKPEVESEGHPDPVGEEGEPGVPMEDDGKSFLEKVLEEK